MSAIDQSVQNTQDVCLAGSFVLQWQLNCCEHRLLIMVNRPCKDLHHLPIPASLLDQHGLQPLEGCSRGGHRLMTLSVATSITYGLLLPKKQQVRVNTWIRFRWRSGGYCQLVINIPVPNDEGLLHCGSLAK